MPRAALALLLAPLAIVIPSSARADPPKLVVILVVDQMRNDYIDDYGGHWTKGLKRLVTEGARFRDAAFHERDPSQTSTIDQCQCQATCVAKLAPQRHALLKPGAPGLIVALIYSEVSSDE